MTEVYPIEADGGGVRMKLIFKVHIYLFHPAERPVPESLPVI